MAKTEKKFKIRIEHTRTMGPTSNSYAEGTLPELIKYFKYTLEVGKSWEHEKGNSKINDNPRTAKALCENLYRAKNNAAANGYSGFRYILEE